MATLITALEAKQLSASFDLTPIISNIADSIISAANAGATQTSVQVTDSVFAQHIPQIISALQAKGYVATSGLKGLITIDWSAAQ